ncbi:MAG TPA: hypothetical protein VEA80_08725 [Vitreimonas sp.]|uniref:hypothetical protein n=1 Tax=Vitreimonas sp. TaxID=3069702 RepID=UPI002D58D45E|nr:hypothetical protein [Vitreimonas sp.]HYD87543.1 hypothetical protein [Vitreimonas sp.]
MTRPLRIALLSAVAFVALAAPAFAGESGWGDGVEVMAEEEMAAERGGISIGGVDINFGAVVTTLVNGVPALTTTLTWTDAGTFIEETVGDIGESINDMTPEELDALGLGELENAGGVVIEDENGVTALVHNVTEGALQNIIINSATGRDLAQEIDVTLELPGFELMQDQLIVEHFGFRISDDLQGIMFYDPGG